MGERTNSVGSPHWATFGHCRESRGDGREYFRDGSDDLSHFRIGGSQSWRPSNRDRDVQNVVDRNDLENF